MLVTFKHIVSTAITKQLIFSFFKELSELSISTFKHIGRTRSARFIGIDLAKFYLLQGQVSQFVCVSKNMKQRDIISVLDTQKFVLDREM